jgi:hypothetical protein
MVNKAPVGGWLSDSRRTLRRLSVVGVQTARRQPHTMLSKEYLDASEGRGVDA